MVILGTWVFLMSEVPLCSHADASVRHERLTLQRYLAHKTPPRTTTGPYV